MSDDFIENVRLWLADPLAVNWASKATVRDLIDEIDRLRAEVERLSLRGSMALTAEHATDCDPA